MQRIFCVAFLLFINYIVFAQNYTVKGKVVFRDKTVSGYIKTQASEETPQSFSFSQSESGEFLPVSDALRIEYEDGNVFERAFVAISIVNKEYLARNKASYEVDKFTGSKYLQQILSGSYPLYVYTDFYGYPHFFYKEPGDTGVIYLRNHTYVDENSKLIEDLAFNNQIQFLFQKNNCKFTASDISSIAYAIPSMRKAFTKLNICKGSRIEDKYTSQNKTKLIPEIIAGMSFQKIKPPGGESNSWQQRPDPIFGGGLFFAPGGNKKGSGFGFDLYFRQVKREGDGLRFFNYSQSFTGSYSASTLNFRPYFRLYLGGDKFKPYASIGFLNLVYMLSLDEEYKDQAGMHLERRSIGASTGFFITPFLSAGLRYKKIAVEFSHESILLKSDANKFFVMARYSIFNR